MWTRVSLTLSHRRLSHTSTQVGSYLFIVGGHDGTAYSSEILFYNLGVSFAWTSCDRVLISAFRSFFPVNLQYEPRTVCGKPPNPRGYHVTIIADSRIFVFGGVSSVSVCLSLASAHQAIQFNGHEVFDDVHILDLAGAAYLPQVMSFRIDVE